MKLVPIPTIGDGSCFLHAVVQSISPLYSGMEDDGKRKLIRKMRRDLSELISEKREDGRTWYEYLSRGSLEELSNTFDDLKLHNMKKFLNSNQWFSHLYVEFISETLDVDIYIIDYNKSRLYNMGDSDLFYKGRDSIVIGYRSECHFETLALIENGEKRTYFSPRSRLISKLNSLLHTNRLNKDQN